MSAPLPGLIEVAEQIGVTPATLRRWVNTGAVPQPDGVWTPAARAHARVVARLRERGHSLESIRRANQEGKLAFGYVEDLFPADARTYTLGEASRETGLEKALIERILRIVGISGGQLDRIGESEIELLRYEAKVLRAGLPLVAALQLMRVYAQAMATVADAEVRLFHLYVHEPLMRSGTSGIETAEEMLSLSQDLLPLASPAMDQIHQRYLQHFIEQDVVGHMEADLGQDAPELGKLRVAIAFADLAGYTRMTEEEGELEAVDAVERFVDAVETSLPDEARVIKTIGDEVMIVSSDAGTLTRWAVAFQRQQSGEHLPRIGIHLGEALYRDGDYYGRDVNIASRVAARAAGGEVLVTRPITTATSGLRFDFIAQVRLKGFSEPTEIFIAAP